MSIFNEILAPRYARMLQKLFGIKGAVPVKQLAGEIAPAFLLFSGAENRYLETWSLFGVKESITGVAAQDSAIRFRNPAGSNTIAIITSILVWTSLAATEFFLEFQNGDPGNLLNVPTPANFDNRLNPPGTGSNGAQCFISSNTNIGQGAHVVFMDYIINLANSTTPDLISVPEQEIPMLPGSSLQLRSVTQNVSMAMSIRWRERALEESERA